nr:HEPN domain-containing protein [Halomonas sp. CnH100-B]
MYVRTSSYQITDDQGNLESASISNNNLEKIPINNNFFSSNETLNKLWELNDKRINGPKLNDIDSRVINSALALGESALTADKKNSIIYTCMSLEILFSYDQGGLFQRSIGEKLSDLFTFIVARDKETRLKTGKVVKKVYGMRSAIVHGGDKELTDENLLVNFLMRAAISEILNAEKFKGVSNIARLYEMLKEAQNSY